MRRVSIVLERARLVIGGVTNVIDGPIYLTGIA